jgi:hypothetical protein
MWNQIGAAFEGRVTTYPVQCHLKLTKFTDNANALDGIVFTMTSIVTSAITWQLLTSTTASKLTSQIPATTNMPLQTPTRTSSSLSGGATAGIGIGAALGTLAIIAVIFVAFWLKRKRRRQNREPSQRQLPEAHEQRPQIAQDHHGLYEDVDGRGNWWLAKPVYESDGKPVVAHSHELTTEPTHRVAEMDGNGRPPRER